MPKTLFTKHAVSTYPFNNMARGAWWGQNLTSATQPHFATLRTGPLVTYPGQSTDILDRVWFNNLFDVMGDNSTVPFKILTDVTGLFIGSSGQAKKYGFRFNYINVDWQFRIGAAQRTSTNPAAFAQPVRLINLTTPTIQLMLSKNWDVDVQYKSQNATDTAHLDPYTVTKWTELRADRNGLYHYKQRWKPTGAYLDSVFSFPTPPVSVAQWKSKVFPFQFANYANTELANAAISYEGSTAFGAAFPNNQVKHLGFSPKNIFPVPGLQVVVPGIGSDTSTPAQGAAVFFQVEIEARISGSISVVGNNVGMAGTVFPLDETLNVSNLMRNIIE